MNIANAPQLGDGAVGLDHQAAHRPGAFDLQRQPVFALQGGCRQQSAQVGMAQNERLQYSQLVIGAHLLHQSRPVNQRAADFAIRQQKAMQAVPRRRFQPIFQILTGQRFLFHCATRSFPQGEALRSRPSDVDNLEEIKERL